MQLNNTTISCLRCTDLCLQCNVDGATCGSQSPCHQCDAAGIDFCTFPPSIHHVNPQSNSRCLSCIENKTKCLFGNSSDSKCICCTKQHLHCCFKLKGEWCLRCNMLAGPFCVISTLTVVFHLSCSFHYQYQDHKPTSIGRGNWMFSPCPCLSQFRIICRCGPVFMSSTLQIIPPPHGH